MARAKKTTETAVETIVGPVMPAAPATIARVAPSDGYSVGKQAKARTTLQAGAKNGLGSGWRAVATAKRNTREVALEAILAIGEAPYTEAEILKALAEVKEHLGSGTPRSYFRAFVASGYLVEGETEE